MKRLLRRVFLLSLLTLLLCGTARAADGLDAFADSRAMTPVTFSDVTPANGLYSGIKNAYDMGIMEGKGGGTFAPGQTVPWSQAVVIAARVRSAYRGETVPAPAAGEVWYAPYAAYAQRCGILPENHPVTAAAWNQPIDRQSIAYLFAAVVDAADCPSISDLDIPDLSAVAADKREAVRAMYDAGIITGKADGRFDPAGLTTRGQLATIVTRLLRPAYRVAHDSLFNSDMLGQEGNFAHDSGLCHDGAYTYLIYREDGEGARQHILRREDAAGSVTTLFSTGDGEWERLSDLSIHDGWLYFFCRDAQKSYALKRLSLSDGTVEKLCAARDLDKYVLYGERIFTVRNELRSDMEFYGVVSEVVNGSVRTLTTVKDSVETLHCYGGKLFISTGYGDEVVAYDLSASKAETVLTGMGASVFCGGKIYFVGQNGRELSGQLWQASLSAPDRPVKYGTVPASALVHYVNLNHDGKDLYYLASGSRALYRIAPGREAEKVLTTYWATVENPIVWKNCFLAGDPGLQVANYTGEYPVTTGLNSGSRTTNVDEWLGRTALMVRTDFPQQGKGYTDNAPLSGSDAVAVRRAYISGDKLVLDIEYRNPDAVSRYLQSLTVTLEAGGTVLSREAVGRRSMPVAPGKSVQLTMVIQGSDLLARNTDLTNLKWKAVAAYVVYD